MNIIESRAKLMKEMDNYICNTIGDEDIIDIWLMDGVPDGSTEADLLDLAKIECCWLNIVNCFASCLRMAGVIE